MDHFGPLRSANPTLAIPEQKCEQTSGRILSVFPCFLAMLTTFCQNFGLVFVLYVGGLDGRKRAFFKTDTRVPKSVSKKCL